MSNLDLSSAANFATAAALPVTRGYAASVASIAPTASSPDRPTVNRPRSSSESRAEKSVFVLS